MKKLICVILSLCVLLMLAACASSNSPESSENIETPPASNSTAPSDATDPAEEKEAESYDGKTIEIMYTTDVVWEDVVENYAKPAIQEAFPGLTVEFIANQGQPIETLAAVDALPDIWFGVCSDALVNSNIVMDMSTYLDQWLKDNFANPDFYRDSRGRVWTVGSGTDTFYTSVYYYNVDIFNELGLSAPETFDDLLSICQTLLDAGYTIPLSHSGWTTSVYWLEQAIMSYDPDAYTELMANKTDFNDPRIRAAIANVQKLIDMGALGIGTVEKDATVSISEFVQGDAVMMSTYSWNSGSIAGQTDFEVGQFFLPSANDKYPTGTAYTCWGSFLNGWNVDASTENPELVLEVLKVLVDAEAQRNFDNGLVTNYVVEGELTFANTLDAERYEMWKGVEKWGSAFYPNALDSAAQGEYFSAVAEWLMDDSDMDADAFCDRMQEIWEANTFFDTF